jgi:hypothetical protein
MIISNSKKFIFVKPPKCAGTSIENSFLMTANQKDIYSTITHTHDFEEKHLNLNYLLRNDYVFLKNNFMLKIQEHASLENIKFFCDVLYQNKLCDDFFNFDKISIIRNPWDRIISHYYWDIFIFNYKNTTLNDFLNKADFKLNCWNYYTLNNKFNIDTLIIYEDLENNFNKKITSKYNVKLHELKFKSFTRKNKEPYWKMFNEKTAETVYNYCKLEIDFFGYEFGKTHPKNFN